MSSHESTGKSKTSLYRFKKEGKIKRSNSIESVDSSVSAESSASSAFIGGNNVTQFDQVWYSYLDFLKSIFPSLFFKNVIHIFLTRS